MLCLGDVDELLAHWSPAYAVQVVKNPLRYEWPSVMLFTGERCYDLKPDWIDNEDNKPQMLEWGRVGDLPPEWNHLVGYDQPKPAKLVHYTQGIPAFPETKDCEYSKEWWDESKKCMSTVSWKELMGNSIHAKPVLERLNAR